MSDETMEEVKETTKSKKGPGRPSKSAPTKTETLTETVTEILNLVSDKKVRINFEEQTAGVDLGSRGNANGTEFRQLFVKADAGFIALRLIEGFKPAHGGTEQRKTLYSVVVPVGQSEAYNALQRRFFAYDLSHNVEQSTVFLKTLRETIAKDF